jgi:hypothetical protein
MITFIVPDAEHDASMLPADPHVSVADQDQDVAFLCVIDTYRAAQRGDDARLAQILRSGADADAVQRLVTWQNEAGHTALHAAAIGRSYSHLTCIRLLLDAGASPWAKTSRRPVMTPLHAAGMAVMQRTDSIGDEDTGALDVAIAAFEMIAARAGGRCADDPFVDVPPGTSLVLSGTFTLMHAAVARRSPALVRLLVEHGGNPCAMDSHTQSPWFLAHRALEWDERKCQDPPGFREVVVRRAQAAAGRQVIEAMRSRASAANPNEVQQSCCGHPVRPAWPAGNNTLLASATPGCRLATPFQTSSRS